MIRRPPRSTRTDTLFPYTTLFRSDWALRARLAFGVTTAFDPSTLGIDQIAYQDLIDAGLMVGPRLRSTGPALFSKERFTSLDQVRAVLRRYRDAWGRSEERRVGKECVSTCRLRWSSYY